jgi:hypothetical protein
VELVRRDARGVEPAGQVVLLQHHGLVAFQGEVGRAGQRRGPCAHERDAAAALGAGARGDHLGAGAGLVVEQVLRGVALEPADGDGRLVPGVVHARPHAEHLDGAHPRAGVAEDVLRQDGAGRAEHVAGGDLPDELRDVDLRGAGGDAGGVAAIEAALGLLAGLGGRVRGLRVGQARLQTVVGQRSGARMAHGGGCSLKGKRGAAPPPTPEGASREAAGPTRAGHKRRPARRPKLSQLCASALRRIAPPAAKIFPDVNPAFTWGGVQARPR